MALNKIAEKIYDTDLLVIGGGTGGCPLAAKAAEKGLRVLLVDKSNTVRSGNVGHGTDSYGIMALGKMTTLQALRIFRGTVESPNHMFGRFGPGRWTDENVDYVLFKKGMWAIEELEKQGVPMRWYDGEYYWTPHLLAPGIKAGLRVHWQNVKEIMTNTCLKRGVNILNRVMVVDLLTNNGKVVGATAVDTRTGEFILIRAKAVALAAGFLCRTFNAETPMTWKYKFRYHYCPASISGDGFAMAYRAGANLINMDHNTHGFRLRDDCTLSVGNLPNNDGCPGKAFTWRGEEIGGGEINSYYSYDKAEHEGVAPFYHSLTHLPDDFQKRLELNYYDEWMAALKHAQDRKFNPRTHWYESGLKKPLQFMQLHGMVVDEHFKSPDVKGLYAVGDNAAGVGGAYGACISGLTIGDEVSDYINSTDGFDVNEDQAESQKQIALAPLNVKENGAEWADPMDMECAIRFICERYVGLMKSEGMMLEGVRRLNSLRRDFRAGAKNPHYLMRALEVRNIMDMAEIHIIASLNRKETRQQFIRADYPNRDPEWDLKCTYQRLENGKPLLELVEVPALKKEYIDAEGGNW